MRKHKQLNAPSASTLFTVVDPNSPISEQYRTIRTNIQYAQFETRTKNIVVTSSGPSEGKSTTSANLAVAFAQAGIKTLLVDADLRRPTSHLTFDLSNNMGLSNLLSVKRLSASEVIQETDLPNLSVMTSGPKSPNPSELLASQRMKKVISVLDNLYEFVIFDMPPVATVTDAQLIASQVDGVVLSVREGVADKKSLERAVTLLEKVDARIIGAVYIGTSDSGNQQYYYYYS